MTDEQSGKVRRRFTPTRRHGQKGGFARIEVVLTRVRSLVLAASVIAIFVFVSASIIFDVSEGTYLIEPITVSSTVVAEVPDKDGIASQLRDAIGGLSKLARDDVAIRPVRADIDEPKVSITGTSFSVREVATLVREHTGWAYAVIGGELLAVRGPPRDNPNASGVGGEPPRFRLTLRLNDGVTGPFFDGTGEYGDVISRGAAASLHEIDPVTAAAALSTMDHQHRLMADAWIDDVLLSARDDGKPKSWSRLLASDKSRAMLVKANVSLSLERYDLALEVFERANAEFKARNGRDWASARDGQATAHLLRAETEWRRLGKGALQAGSYREDMQKADVRVRESLVLDPGSGSATYHLAQIADAEARHWFEAPETYREGDGCDGFAKLAEADRRYASLTSRHPDFAIAYDHQAIMIMQELLWLRTNKTTRCGVGHGTAEVFETELFDAAEALFAKAESNDPTLAEAWLQNGVLLAEEQQSDYSIRRFALLERRTLLKMGLLRFGQASELSPWDGYLWQRWARAEHQLAALGLDDVSPLDASADEHFCKAVVAFQDAWTSRGASFSDGTWRGSQDLAGALGERQRAGFDKPCPGLAVGSGSVHER